MYFVFWDVRKRSHPFNIHRFNYNNRIGFRPLSFTAYCLKKVTFLFCVKRTKYFAVSLSSSQLVTKRLAYFFIAFPMLLPFCGK